MRTFESVTRFTAGTIGEPGSRSFWIQIRSGDLLISAAAEKSQVEALGERFEEMLREIRLAHPAIPRPTAVDDNDPLETPVIGEFRIGAIAIFFDEFTEKVQVDLREVNMDSADEDFFEIESPSLDEMQMVRLFITLDQVKAFIARAHSLVRAGRLPCPFCANPIDPRGHICPRANGYRR